MIPLAVDPESVGVLGVLRYERKDCAILHHPLHSSSCLTKPQLKNTSVLEEEEEF
jgi:hypothetical protein